MYFITLLLTERFSTELHTFVNSIYNTVDKLVLYYCSLFSDLKKAFDECSHSMYVSCFKKRRINDVTDEWFKNYFYVPQAYILHLLESCRFSKRICFPRRF
jgi:hypothetical protein